MTPSAERGDGHPGAAGASARALSVERVLSALRSRLDELHEPVHGPGFIGSGRVGPGVTQAELARLSGLAPATVSTIVRDLCAAGVLEADHGRGRLGSAVRFSRRSGVVAGIDFGHSHLSVGVADLSGHLLVRRRAVLDADHGHEQGLDLARGLLAEVLEEVGQRTGDVLAVGLGLPAPLSRGVVRSASILPGWTGVRADAVAADFWGCDVIVDNDANLSAFAEQRVGAGRGHDDVVAVKISSGVGAGLVVGGRLVRGAGGMAGEVGHLTVDEGGPVCRCGSRGCLEAYASGAAVQRMLAEQLPGASLAEIVAAAREGNVVAGRAIEDVGLHLGWGIATMVNLLNPGVVVVVGEIAGAGEGLLAPVRTALRRHALDVSAATPVVAGALGEDAALVGALLLAAESAADAAVAPAQRAASDRRA